jgi:hypothetical protein
MKRISRLAKTGAKTTWSRTLRPAKYEHVIDALVSEMARLMDTTELRTFFPPFELVIIGNRGCVAFAGQVDRDGEVRPSSPLRRLRRSDFPANALITDRSLATRTFRIDCADA